jgi:hypothetical protein
MAATNWGRWRRATETTGITAAESAHRDLGLVSLPRCFSAEDVTQCAEIADATRVVRAYLATLGRDDAEDAPITIWRAATTTLPAAGGP